MSVGDKRIERLIEGAFRQSALLLRSRSPVQDVIDLAELALSAGEEQGALLLFGVAALELGLSGDGLRWQAAIADRTGLWAAPVKIDPESGVSMLARALDELRGLIALAPPLGFTQHGTGLSARSTTNAPDLPLERLTALADDLRVKLRTVLEAGTAADVMPIVRTVRETTEQWTVPSVSRRANASTAVLAWTVALTRLQDLVVRIDELCSLGWSGNINILFHLDPAGLGPLFNNVPRLSNGHDLPALLRLANGNPLPLAGEVAWLLSLVVSMPARVASGIVMRLIRSAQFEALQLLVGRAYRMSDREWLWLLRDTDIAFGHGVVAAEAQGNLAKMSPYDSSEWIILGDLLGLLEDREGADRAYAHCASLGVDRTLGPRRATLGTGDHLTVITSSGFFSEPERLRLVSGLIARRKAA